MKRSKNPHRPRLPKDFGKLPPADPNFRPLTEKDLAGFTAKDWALIVEHFQSADFPLAR